MTTSPCEALRSARFSAFAIPLLAEDLDGLLHVAAGLFERLLAIHHAGAGAGRSSATSFAVIAMVVMSGTFMG